MVEAPEATEQGAAMKTASAEAVRAELARARAKYPDFHSSHEGHSLIREELEELWDLVKADHSTRPSDLNAFGYKSPPNSPPSYRQMMRDECIQVAAMAIRFIEDLCEENEDAG
jgi:hypothetical protein